MVAIPAEKIVSQAAVARLLGVSRQRVSAACQPGQRLHCAVAAGGVDASHSAVRAWLVERGGPAAPLPDQPSAEPEGDDEPDEVSSTDLGQLGKLTLQQLSDEHGNVRELRAFLRARRDLEESRRAQMRRMRLQGTLIPVHTVDVMVDLVDAAFRMLLTDAPRAIATRLAVRDTGAATALVRDLMSQHLKRAKDGVLEALRANDPTAPIPQPKEPNPVDENSPVYGEEDGA